MTRKNIGHGIANPKLKKKKSIWEKAQNVY